MRQRRLPTRAEKLLIIPDAHAHPSYDNRRFDLLGRLIRAEKPSVIVCLGDFADMPSLSSHEGRGTKSFEGKRYRKDVAATRDAMKRLDSAAFRRARKVMLLGNHEARIDRAMDALPELDGLISIDDLGYEAAGWRVVPFKDTATVCGFAMSHHFPSGIMGRPIGGETVAANLIRQLHCSAVVGHNHVFDHAERTRPDGRKLVGISAGCFTHPRMVEGWNRATARLWWQGVVILENARDGAYGAMRTITQAEMRRRYS